MLINMGTDRGRRVLAILFVLLVMLAVRSVAEPLQIGEQTIDLRLLTPEELNDLSARVKEEISDNHNIRSSEKKAVLKAVKSRAGEYYSREGIDVSWPMGDYQYTKDGSLFTVSTKVTYKRYEQSRTDEIYAELVGSQGQYEVSYLVIGAFEFIDYRDRYDLGRTATLVYGNQTLDILALTSDEIRMLSDEIDREFSLNRKVNHFEEDEVRKAAKEAANAYFEQMQIQVSWPVFKYETTKSGDHFTLSTEVKLKADGSVVSVVAQVGRMDVEYTVSSLMVDGREVLSATQGQSEVPE